jgi:hypothetical protein
MTAAPRARPPRPRRARAIAGGLLALAALAPACAHPAASPADTLSRFGAAVERKDYAAAYALTSAEYRARVSQADFRALVEGDGAEAQAIARRWRESAARAPMRIPVEDELGGDTALVLEASGQWRVDGRPFDLYSQRTPRAALRMFVIAIERQRYDLVLRLVPDRYRPGVDADKLHDYWEGDRKAENQKLLQQLKANIGAPIVETGDEARMPYGDGAEVRFLLEDGLWKIEDPD